MEMNDILSGLNSCDDNGCDSATDNANLGGCDGNIGNAYGLGNGLGYGLGNSGLGCGLGNGFGCGFGSWIWILLILFYCGCGGNFLGGYNNNAGGCCNNSCGCNNCCECNSCGCCGCNNYGSNSCGNNNRGIFGGLFGNCTGYLFLLVILFLCNGFNRGFGGNCGGCLGNIGGYGNAIPNIPCNSGCDY